MKTQKVEIEVPVFEGFEFVDYRQVKKGEPYWGQDSEIRIAQNLNHYKVFVYRKTEPEVFDWPEHLPDGTELDYTIDEDGEHWWLTAVSGDLISVDVYNKFTRPEDQITIPDWLENNPRTIVKGE